MKEEDFKKFKELTEKIYSFLEDKTLTIDQLTDLRIEQAKYNLLVLKIAPSVAFIHRRCHGRMKAKPSACGCEDCSGE